MGQFSVNDFSAHGLSFEFRADVFPRHPANCAGGFEVWLVTGTRYPTITPSDFERKNWVMTAPRTYQFSSDTLHDSGHVYTYSLDTATAEGRENVSWLLHGKGTTVDGVMDSSLQQNMDSLTNVIGSQLDRSGTKEVLLVVRSLATCFSDTTIWVFGTIPGFGWSERLTFDWYPPLIYVDPSPDNPLHLGNDSVITGPFSFALDEPAVEDLGGTPVTAVRLMVSRKPAGMVWDPDSTPSTLLLEDLADHVVGVYPLDIPGDTCVVRSAVWEAIEPAGWPLGEYLMAVVTVDQFGQTCFPRVHAYGSTNPWLVRYEP